MSRYFFKVDMVSLSPEKEHKAGNGCTRQATVTSSGIAPRCHFHLLSPCLRSWEMLPLPASSCWTQLHLTHHPWLFQPLGAVPADARWVYGKPPSQKHFLAFSQVPKGSLWHWVWQQSRISRQCSGHTAVTARLRHWPGSLCTLWDQGRLAQAHLQWAANNPSRKHNNRSLEALGLECVSESQISTICILSVTATVLPNLSPTLPLNFIL